MVRVFLSRYTPDLHPGEGASIDWQIGERTVVISGQDANRIFVVESEGMSHPDAPPGTYVREGHFEDEPDQRYAKAESALWFVAEPNS